jgi:dolichol kinase
LAKALGAAAAWRWAAGGGAAAPRGRILVASAGAAALEATTEQLDNAFLPLHFLTLSQLAAAGGW